MLFVGLGVSAILSVVTVAAILRSMMPADLEQFAEASRRVVSGGLYDQSATYAYRWSPLLAYALGPLSAVPWLWRAAQLALALTMPSRRLTLLVLVAFPFWFDVWLGNVNVLVLWLAAWGLSGNRWAIAGFLGLALLIPRPLVMPLVAWFLWREPWTRLPFAVAFGVNALAVYATGWGPAWLGRLASSGDEVGSVWNLGPSRLVGSWWLPIGAALALVAFLRGRPGLAGLLVAPYWLPYYFLLPLADLARAVAHDGARAEGRVVGVRHVLPHHVDRPV